MSLSVCPFCHGDRGAIGRSRIHRTKTPDQKVAINPNPIANDVLRCLCPGICLGELTDDPFGTSARWVYVCHADTGVWKSRVKTSNPMQSGMTPTAGGVVFFGNMGGNFYAVDATDGPKLWGQKIGGAIGGGVITYTATGTQKIAVATGLTEVLWPTDITTACVSILGLDIGKLKSNSRFKMRREKLKTGFACAPQKGDP